MKQEQAIIAQAIKKHGATVVYNAAIARMDGQSQPLATLGIDPGRHRGTAYKIMRTSFSAMSATEQAADIRDARRSLQIHHAWAQGGFDGLDIRVVMRLQIHHAWAQGGRPWTHNQT